MFIRSSYYYYNYSYILYQNAPYRNHTTILPGGLCGNGVPAYKGLSYSYIYKYKNMSLFQGSKSINYSIITLNPRQPGLRGFTLQRGFSQSASICFNQPLEWGRDLPLSARIVSVQTSLQSCLICVSVSARVESLVWMPSMLICGSCIYLFGVLRRFQPCTRHIMTGSWKGRGNQYIQIVRVLYCKLPTNGKKLPAFPLEAVPGTEPRPQRWEARVLPLCHHGPLWPPVALVS